MTIQELQTLYSETYTGVEKDLTVYSEYLQRAEPQFRHHIDRKILNCRILLQRLSTLNHQAGTLAQFHERLCDVLEDIKILIG